MKKSTLVFVLLLVLGVFIRLFWLEKIPSGFFKDESSFVYNAYSIWQTGKDEYGVSFPLIFRSFEVFLLPLYIYLSAPIVGIFGLNEFTGRLLSSLSGIAALIIIYFIAKALWSKKAALFSMTILVFSPWHILYSRGVFEGNLGLSLFSAGFLFLVWFFKFNKHIHLILSAIFFALSMYSYQAERVVVPAFLLCVLVISYKRLLANRRKVFLPTILGLVILIPIITFTFKTAGVHRAFGVSAFNKPPHGLNTSSEYDFWKNNKVFLRTKQLTSLYLSYFSPRNLFSEGDSEKQRSVDGFSVFYPWCFPFLAVGAYILLRKRRFYDNLLFVWILAAPIPAALTADPFHTYRSLLLYLPLTLVSGYGVSFLYEKVKLKKLFLFVFAFMTAVGFAYFVYKYAVITQSTNARNWDYGYKEIFEFLKNYEGDRIVIHDRWTEAYVHMLFFNRFDPQKYHKAVYELGNPLSFYYTDPSEIRPQKVENFEFREVDWSKERGDKGTIFVFDANDLPESEFEGDPNIELLREIYYPGGAVSYRIVRVKE